MLSTVTRWGKSIVSDNSGGKVDDCRLEKPTVGLSIGPAKECLKKDVI